MIGGPIAFLIKVQVISLANQFVVISLQLGGGEIIETKNTWLNSGRGSKKNIQNFKKW